MSVSYDLTCAMELLDWQRALSADEEMRSRAAMALLLRSPAPPAKLLAQLAWRFEESATQHASNRSQQGPSGHVIFRDDQLTSDERDMTNAMRYLDHGFTNAPGKEKSNVDYSSAEIVECQQAIARLLRKRPPPVPLLMSLAADFAPTKPQSNSEGLLRLEGGRIVLGHRRKGRNDRFLDREMVASMMKAPIGEHGSERRAAAQVGKAIGLPGETVRSRWKKWKAKRSRAT